MIDVSRSHLLNKHFSILRWTLKITHNENKVLEQPFYDFFSTQFPFNLSPCVIHDSGIKTVEM